MSAASKNDDDIYIHMHMYICIFTVKYVFKSPFLHSPHVLPCCLPFPQTRVRLHTHTQACAHTYTHTKTHTHTHTHSHAHKHTHTHTHTHKHTHTHIHTHRVFGCVCTSETHLSLKKSSSLETSSSLEKSLSHLDYSPPAPSPPPSGEFNTIFLMRVGSLETRQRRQQRRGWWV